MVSDNPPQGTTILPNTADLFFQQWNICSEILGLCMFDFQTTGSVLICFKTKPMFNN